MKYILLYLSLIVGWACFGKFTVYPPSYPSTFVNVAGGATVNWAVIPGDPGGIPTQHQQIQSSKYRRTLELVCGIAPTRLHHGD